MKNFLKHALVGACCALALNAWGYRYQYDTVDGDPMHTLMYTLPNGLKVYMSVNKDEPRIQTNIAVRVGSKNDPAETTGLAHYFEHMMFKGTEKFGTSDYAAEKPMLDQIEELFETYRTLTDSAQRADMYHQIDSISYEAAKIAIPNEYDKLMSAIGANGTNAYTSYDMTCYVEDIPSNEIERWAMVQADRFQHPVLRGFHTELETIYEEKNMSLTKDSRKMTETMLATLFPDHPYGQWSVLGHQTHLKNPSLTNIKNYHKQWYVPNNMAILMAGDFDPDNVIDIITKYFGDMQPNPNLPKLHLTEPKPLDKVVAKDVYGNEAEALLMAWMLPGATNPDMETLEIMDAMLNNGKAGLIDLNINKAQKALGVGTGLWGLADGGAYVIQGHPGEGQSLDELRELILEQVALLRNGEFDESLIPATINNFKLGQQRMIESNRGRVSQMEDIFINEFDPATYATRLDRQSKLTKADLMAFANKYLRDDNYVAIYKRQGKDTTQLKIAKAPITPLPTNRDVSSQFLTDFIALTPAPIEPVFVDFDKDLSYLTSNGSLPVLYKKNESNDVFQLTYVFDFGINHDKEMSMLTSYFPLLGTDKYTPEELAEKFYDLACSYGLSSGGNRTFLIITGLSENMEKAMDLVEELMANAKPDAESYQKVVERTIKSREDSKLNQSTCLNRLCQTMIYGPDALRKINLTNEEIKNIDPKALTDKLARINDMQHTIIYYGPMEGDQVVAALNQHHQVPATLAPAPEKVIQPKAEPTETVFYLAPYDAKQFYMQMFGNEGKPYDADLENGRKLYNEYFGGGMNSIVFQEMREARSLAYSAWAAMDSPNNPQEPYTYLAMIATQNDKMEEAIDAFDDIINNMPESEKAFDLAKTGLDSRIRSKRIIKDQIAWSLLNNRDLGIKGDSRKPLYEALPSMTLADVISYQEANVKGRPHYVAILGDIEDLDIDALRARGKVVMLTLDEIFPY